MPSITLVEELLANGGEVRGHDPEAMREARRHFGDRITYCAKPYEALEGEPVESVARVASGGTATRSFHRKGALQ